MRTHFRVPCIRAWLDGLDYYRVMTKLFGAYAATLVALIALDAIWLGVVASSLYAKAIGHLMAPQPDPIAALAFYLVYPIGLMLFVIAPGGPPMRLAKTVQRGAAFGFFAYATYDLSNLATLKNWPASVSIIDIAWGCVVSAGAACAGKLVLDRMAPR